MSVKGSIPYKISEERALSHLKLDGLFSAIGWKPRGKEKWQEVLTKSSHVITAWDDKENLVGMGRILGDGVMCMFYDIGVDPAHQHAGLGTQIVEKLIDKVKDKGYASIGLFAWEENRENIPFYRKFGFEQRAGGMELIKYMSPE